MMYKKKFEDENIQIGDIIALNPDTNAVTLAFKRFKNKSNNVIGICTKIENNSIYVANCGIIDVNVKGLVCIGDKLTVSPVPGKAEAIKYEHLEEKQFGIRSIGKVIGLYKDWGRAKILIDLE